MTVSNRLTRLQAVNICLRGARETPVSSLDEDQINEVTQALQILDEHDMDVQSTPLYTNTYEIEYTPDDDGHIDLPPSTLFVTGWGQSIRRDLHFQEEDNILRLYDIDARTSDFSDDPTIYVRISIRLDFEEGLTYRQQRWIADGAAHEYQMAVMGSASMNQILEQKAARSRMKARAENMRQMKPNMFTNSRSNMARAQARLTPRPWLVEGDGQRYNRSNC